MSKTVSPISSSETLIPSPTNRIPSIYAFNGPSHAGIEFALHRRGNNYYVVFPRNYGMAESRWVASLNQPRSNNPEETAPPASHPHLNRRFWFNTDSTMITLEDLLNHTPIRSSEEPVQLLKVTGTSTTEKKAGRGEQVEVEVKQVEVLLSEDRFCWRCAYCGSWEVTISFLDDSGGKRYQKVGQDGDDAVYWCGVSRVCPSNRISDQNCSLFKELSANTAQEEYVE